MAVDSVGSVPHAVFARTSNEPVDILLDADVVRIPNGRLDTVSFPINVLLVCTSIIFLYDNTNYYNNNDNYHKLT